MTDVQKLVDRAKSGDRQAFAELYDQFAPLIRSVVYDATGCLHESEDLCQDVFLHAYRNLGQLRDATRFAGWLMMIARRACASWGRTQNKRYAVGLEGIDLADKHSGLPDEDVQRMLDAIRQLPTKERTALHLFYLTEQPVAAAREALGMSTSGFYRVLERARKHVGAILQRRKVKR
jgi:RNA polymerase sigma-70 factor, ECF subfamily